MITKKTRRKITGEAKLFQEIWNSDRPKVSFISGLPVKCESWTFAHVISKSQRPDLRLIADNIVYLTRDEHFLYDQGTEEQRKKYPADWEKLYRYRDELKAKYSKAHAQY